MNKKCLGCGAFFQTIDENKVGYVDECNIDKSIVCKRCFSLKNYGSYKLVYKDKIDYDSIFKNIKNDLVIFVSDILEVDDSIKRIKDFKNAILVITKKDLLPKSIKEEKIKSFIRKNYNINNYDIIFTCSNKNYNLDLLYEKINKYNKTGYIYFIGNTNAGKSSLINSLIKSYSNLESYITTSFYPNTTLNSINIKINDKITFIDTPGIINENSYIYTEDKDIIKKIISKKEIKPITYQLKENESLLIGDFARIDYINGEKNSFTFYLSNNIKISKINLEKNKRLTNLPYKKIDVSNNKDLVISGLLFCKIVKKSKIKLYIKENVEVFLRNNLI